MSDTEIGYIDYATLNVDKNASYESLEDRVVLITGAGQAIGRGYAHYFSAHGAIPIIADINAIKANLPETGNPVWIFPTDSTNFARIQADLDTMLISAEKIAAVPTDSAAYHTGMLDINSRSALIQENIADAIPYMYVSFSNIIFSSIWIAAILGIFAVLNKRKQKMQEYDVSQDV